MAETDPGVMRLEDLIALVLNVDVSVLAEHSCALTVDGWDSLAQVALISAVEETYGVTFDLADMRAAQTMGDIRRVLDAKGVSR
jgi:acyl carrier protein